jgi:LuxR family transcriptional regulator, maltose regulon positive regulatory protein
LGGLFYNGIVSAPILATKLYIPPPRPRVVHRGRLIERLQAGLQRAASVILISAPAGFGKTTLVSEWIDDCRLRRACPAVPGIADWNSDQASLNPQSSIRNPQFAWLSLDKDDNELPRFLAYFIAACQTVAPRAGEATLGALQSVQPPPTDVLLTALLNDLAALDDAVLVLDDYHVIESHPIDEALAFFVDHLPPRFRLVIASREDPPLPLARLRAHGRLTELRAADLRFTPDEAAAFLNEVMGLQLSASDIAALEARTEGWIAGLQLAALALQGTPSQGTLSMEGRPDTANFIQAFTGSHRFVLDYLVEEVLQRQPEHVRNFLLQTAILDRLSSPLCDAVTGQEDGRAMLESLERGNLFVIPLDDQRRWYRYHHLFAEVLQAHLREAQPERMSALHRRASEWYEHNGSTDNAIRHALAARDFDRAAGLIELAWSATADGSQSTKWLGWAKALPDELVRRRPGLSVWVAYALLGRGDMEAAAARLTDAERWLEPADEEPFRSLPATIAIARAYLAQALGDVPGTVTYARRALDLTPEANHLGRGQATALLGLAYWAGGDLEAANRIFAGYTTMLRAAGNILDAISTTHVLADIRMALGRLHEAASTLEQALQFVVDQGEPIPPAAADLYRGLGELYRERGDLESAARYLLKSKELGEQAELLDWPYRQCVAQARMKQTQGELDGALDLLNEAERLFVRTPLPDVRPISALRARIWVAQGRLIEAQGWARERGLSVGDAPSYLREFEHVTLARLLIARHRGDRGAGSIHEAIGLLERLLQAAEEGTRIGSVIEISALLALAHAAQGDMPLALVSLERALTLAEPEGYVRLFVDEGEPMRLLIADCREPAPLFRALRIENRANREGRRLIGYTARLLAAFVQPAAVSQSAIRDPKSAIPEPLSEREQDVLRLLRTDLSGPEIARECMVSLSTVRTHTQNIYAKLGVNNRRAAVRRAEELDLL